jgi:hypothetical protein
MLQTSIGENVVWVLLTGMGIKLFDHQRLVAFGMPALM